MRWLLKVPTVAALAVACAVPQQRSITTLKHDAATLPTEPPRLGPTSESVAGDELRARSATSLSEAIRRVRQEFLRPTEIVLPDGRVSAIAPSVYLNGTYSGGVEQLETIPLDAVEEVRFIRPSRARDWWGPTCNCAAGVIHVRTRPTR